MTWLSTMVLAIAFAAMPILPGFADEAARATIQAACETNMNVPTGTCPCLAGKAGAELDDLQQAWLAASMAERTSEALALKDRMEPMQAMQAGMFLVNGMPGCAG